MNERDIRKELQTKSKEELELLACANGLNVEGADKDQLIEILVLAADDELPDEGKVSSR